MVGSYRVIPGLGFTILRCQYDELLKRYPSWMAKCWPNIVLRWNINGPVVNADYFQRLMYLLNYVEL